MDYVNGILGQYIPLHTDHFTNLPKDLQQCKGSYSKCLN